MSEPSRHGRQGRQGRHGKPREQESSKTKYQVLIFRALPCFPWLTRPRWAVAPIGLSAGDAAGIACLPSSAVRITWAAAASRLRNRVLVGGCLRVHTLRSLRHSCSPDFFRHRFRHPTGVGGCSGTRRRRRSGGCQTHLVAETAADAGPFGCCRPNWWWSPRGFCRD